MLPTVGSDTVKIIPYAAEVAGRARGVALMVNLVPDPERRAAIEVSANHIAAVVQQAASAYTARFVFEAIDYRAAVGKGRGVDRGFDATVSVVSETIRTSLPDRSTRNPDYLAVFPNGADAFTSPTVKEDDGLAEELQAAVEKSTLAVKGNVLAVLAQLTPVVGPAATAVRDGEKQVNALFQTELAGRKLIVDALWEERKNIESALGRSGRGLARFIFFDFRKDAGQAPEGEPAEPPPAPLPVPVALPVPVPVPVPVPG